MGMMISFIAIDQSKWLGLVLSEKRTYWMPDPAEEGDCPPYILGTTNLDDPRFTIIERGC